jgi:lipoyl(octanoyl) transferase
MTGSLYPAPARVLDLGIMPYDEAWALQKSLLLQRQNDEIVDTLILVEHPEVVTLGRGSHAENVLNVGGIEVFEVERGGDVTYHGPGQLVGYVIFKLREGERDLHLYLRNMEAALIDVCTRTGLPAGRKAGWTGVWTEGDGPQKKLVSIGVACRKWVTFHGFALNVSTNLSRFAIINPCGLEAHVMGSLNSLIGRDIGMADVKAQVISAVGEAFSRRWVVGG